MATQDYSKRRIFKYELEIKPRQIIMMPHGAMVLSVGRQGPLPYLWASVDENQPPHPRIFRVVTTGEVYNEERLIFRGHVQLGGGIEPWYEAFVFEVMDGIEVENPDVIEDRFQSDMAEVRQEIAEIYENDKNRELVAA